MNIFCSECDQYAVQDTGLCVQHLEIAKGVACLEQTGDTQL